MPPPHCQDPSGIVDLGGATLDLHGGVYAISGPVAIPAFYGNFRIIDGGWGVMHAGSAGDPACICCRVGT